jgi:hypothetical protein
MQSLVSPSIRQRPTWIKSEIDPKFANFYDEPKEDKNSAMTLALKSINNKDLLTTEAGENEERRSREMILAQEESISQN